MQRFRNILVGVDLSRADRLAASDLGAATQQAVTRAIWLASRVGGELTFCAVLDLTARAQELLQEELNSVSGSVETAAATVLDDLVERARKENVPAKSKLVFGKPWLELTRQALREQHDLCFVGTRDPGMASRLLFGSTAMKLLRCCPCPVWVTKPDPDIEDLNILIPSDLSETAVRALEIAVGAGQLVDTKIHLIHAVDDHLETRMWLSGLPQEKVRKFHQKTRDDAEQALYNQLAGTDYRTLDYGVQVHVIDGPPDVAILDAIDEYGIDLLIIGTAARSGVSGMLIGNTAERILAHVPCSVLALKPEDFKCPIELD